MIPYLFVYYYLHCPFVNSWNRIKQLYNKEQNHIIFVLSYIWKIEGTAFLFNLLRDSRHPVTEVKSLIKKWSLQITAFLYFTFFLIVENHFSFSISFLGKLEKLIYIQLDYFDYSFLFKLINNILIIQFLKKFIIFILKN